jgi:hypothetical protein
MKKFVPVLLSVAILAAPLSAEAGIRWPWKKAKQTAEAKPVKAKAKSKELLRVERDLQRLETLLASMKTSAKLSSKSWKSAASEANILATRIQTNVKTATAEKKMHKAADALFNHIQRLKKEADQGDYRQTRRHAAKALSAATHLDELAG